MFHELGSEQMRGVGSLSMPKHRQRTDDEADAPLWGRGVPTAPRAAKLTAGRFAAGSGLVAERGTIFRHRASLGFAPADDRKSMKHDEISLGGC